MPQNDLPPFEVPPERRPRHVAIIMDGNGRWAAQRGEPRLSGHRAGAKAVRATIEECRRLGIGALTLYSFSSENWKRPAEEVGGLMDLYVQSLQQERSELQREGIRFRQIGRRAGLPPAVVRAVEEAEAATAGGSALDLVLAINYGARAEIVDAVRRIAEGVRRGELAPDAIDEDSISSHLDTAGLPDPDLLIRTAGERRLSNFLLWQISYAEIHVTDIFWPDFGAQALRDAVRDFARRERRFGGLASAPAARVETK